MKSNTIYPPMSEREISGAAISREAATQGMVLLKNINGVLPLKGRGKIALFGNGAARTIQIFPAKVEAASAIPANAPANIKSNTRYNIIYKYGCVKNSWCPKFVLCI